MKTLSSSSLRAYASRYPSVRPLDKIAVWGWIALGVIAVLVMAALLWPHKSATITIGVPDLIEQLLPSNSDA